MYLFAQWKIMCWIPLREHKVVNSAIGGTGKIYLNSTNKMNKWNHTREHAKITKNVHCPLSDQTILYDDISCYFIFKPWLITMAMLPKPTMISLLKHSCQDNIFLLKHYTHSF